MIRYRVMIAIIVLVACLGLLNASEQNKPNTAGTSMSTINASREGYLVTVTLRPVNRSYDSGEYWGQEQTIHEVVHSLTITYRGSKVILRRGVFADLADVREISVGKENGFVSVKIVGGDAGGAYTCYLSLRGGALYSRKIHDDVLKCIVEETKYKTK